MGFIVMDEAFDVWKIQKTKYDYHLDFDEWHQRDLEDMVLRDRNHASVIIWSIGNEVMEQRDKNPAGGADQRSANRGIGSEDCFGSRPANNQGRRRGSFIRNGEGCGQKRHARARR